MKDLRTDTARTDQTGAYYTPEIRAEHRRNVQALAEVLAAEVTETGKEIDAAHDEALYDDPEFDAISKELKAEGVDLIPIQSRLLNAAIHGDRIFVAAPKAT